MFETKFSKNLGLLLLLAFSSLIASSLALAVTVRIDQPRVRLVIPQGGAHSGVIDVENPTSEPLKVRVYLEDWVYSSAADGSKEFFPPGTTRLSCARWISFAPAEFTVPPFGRQTVNYAARVPSGARGGHYAVMFFETALGRARDEEGVSVKLLGRLGSLFCIESQGTIIKKARLKNLSVSKDKWLKIKADFVNTGNIDIAPKGTFHIMDRRGMVVARGEFNQLYTLPRDKGQISADWKGSLPRGLYDLVITLDLGEGLPLIKEAQINIGRGGMINIISKD